MERGNTYKLIICLFFLLAINSAFPQDSIFVLHPVIGQTIDKNEKAKYLLFPEITDTTFNYSVITTVQNSYYVNSYFKNDSLLKRKVDPQELKNYKSNISKLIEFYSSTAKKDSSENKFLPPKKDKTYTFQLSPVKKDEIMSETRKNMRLKEDEERLKRVKQGTELEGNRVYLFNPKYRKK